VSSTEKLQAKYELVLYIFHSQWLHYVPQDIAHSQTCDCCECRPYWSDTILWQDSISHTWCHESCYSKHVTAAHSTLYKLVNWTKVWGIWQLHQQSDEIRHTLPQNIIVLYAG